MVDAVNAPMTEEQFNRDIRDKLKAYVAARDDLATYTNELNYLDSLWNNGEIKAVSNHTDRYSNVTAWILLLHSVDIGRLPSLNIYNGSVGYPNVSGTIFSLYGKELRRYNNYDVGGDLANNVTPVKWVFNNGYKLVAYNVFDGNRTFLVKEQITEVTTTNSGWISTSNRSSVGNHELTARGGHGGHNDKLPGNTNSTTTSQTNYYPGRNFDYFPGGTTPNKDQLTKQYSVYQNCRNKVWNNINPRQTSFNARREELINALAIYRLNMNNIPDNTTWYSMCAKNDWKIGFGELSSISLMDLVNKAIADIGVDNYYNEGNYPAQTTPSILLKNGNWRASLGPRYAFITDDDRRRVVLKYSSGMVEARSYDALSLVCFACRAYILQRRVLSGMYYNFWNGSVAINNIIGAAENTVALPIEIATVGAEKTANNETDIQRANSDVKRAMDAVANIFSYFDGNNWVDVPNHRKGLLDNVKETSANKLFDALNTMLNTARNATAGYGSYSYRVCHSNCHSNCHGSRGRR